MKTRPFQRRLVREPCILALGVSAGRLLSGSDRLIQGELITQVSAKLGYANGPHHRQVGIELAFEQCLHFRQSPLLYHMCKAQVASRMQPRPGRKQDHCLQLNVRADPA